MRELLGDLLRAHGEHAQALAEYEASMKNTPNRLRGWYGAAKAADAAGDAKRAAGYYRQLAQLTRTADGDRPELKELSQIVAK
jgi:tetratricopeptide (TPR) repeat protein